MRLPRKKWPRWPATLRKNPTETAFSISSTSSPQSSPPNGLRSFLNKLFDIFEGILRSLFQGGHWNTVEHVLGLLSEAEGIRQDLTEAHKQKLRACFDQLGSQDLVTLIQQYLNTADKPRTEGLGRCCS